MLDHFAISAVCVNQRKAAMNVVPDNANVVRLGGELHQRYIPDFHVCNRLAKVQLNDLAQTVHVRFTAIIFQVLHGLANINKCLNSKSGTIKILRAAPTMAKREPHILSSGFD